MPRPVALVAALLACTLALPPVLRAAVSSEAALEGTWTGSYTGDASGKFTMTFTRDASGKLAGTIEARHDDGTALAKCPFKLVQVDGEKVTLAYDPPDGAPIEVRMDATVKSKALSGGWQVIDAGTRSVSQRGTFSGSRP